MVSMIVPCYNGEKYIGRCLDSVLAQTDTNIELIVVNDGSTDNTNEIIKEKQELLEEKLTRFVYLVQENQGVGAACNNAFKYVTGKYLTLLDADDLILPESIEMKREWLDRNISYDLVRTNGYYVTEEDLECCNRLLEVNDYMKNKENIFEEIFYGTTYVWPGTYMIRMEMLDKIYPDREIYPSRYGQNLQFLMMAAYNSKAGFIDVPLMKYVVREESLSHFSSGNIMQKKINAMMGYKDIRQYLIKTFMSHEQIEEWLNKTEILYERIFVQIACEYRNLKYAKKHYKNLKKLTGNKCDINTRITYYKLNNKFIYLLLKSMRKLRIGV